MYKHDAIIELTSGVVRVTEVDGESVAYDINNNVVSYDANAVATKETEIKNKAEQDAQDIVDNKASGKTKLNELGLSNAEIKALIGED
jgi:small nuclear ribonucleoprotein (snRNP)-like protein|tara:strand:- start:4 stop:267 length:264 start_codon:yes stop_codon:yes gene_type:complete